MDGEPGAVDLAGQWSLDFDALTWVEAKGLAQRLGFAAQLRHYALTGQFAEAPEAIPPTAATYRWPPLLHHAPGRNRHHQPETLFLSG